MSYPFDKKNIISIVYTNKERDTIEIVWQDDDSYVTFYGESADASFQKWLLDNGYTDEVIYENTRDKNAFDAKNFAQMIVKYAEPYIKKIENDYEANYQKFIKDSEAKWNKKFNKMVELKDLASHKTFNELKKQAEKEAKKQSDIIDMVSASNNDSETLFKAKLALFEKASIKNSKDKELKTKIRRAKTLTELLGIIDGHI